MRIIRFTCVIIGMIFSTCSFGGIHIPVRPGISGISLTVSFTGTTCGYANGKIIVNATGGTAPYSYSWNGNSPQNNGLFYPLPAGTYNIHVVDINGLFADTTVILNNTFTAPTANIVSKTNPSSCIASDASLTLSGTGGLPPYTYSIDETNFQSGSTFANLTAGFYHYSVKDANGCASEKFIFHSVVLEGNCFLTEQGLGLSYSCNPFKSQLQIGRVDGGVPPYSYSLDGVNYQNSNTFYPLSEGIYPVWIKDSAGAILLYSVTLVDYCDPYLQLTINAQPAHCGSNGSITITAANGRSPYLYSIDGINFQSNNIFYGLIPGNYTITVKDADGIVSSKFVIIGNSCLSVTATTSPSSCGLKNGSIMGNATGGNTPYLYSIDRINFISSNNFQNVGPGNYFFYAKDITNAIDSFFVNVQNISGPQIDTIISDPAGCLEDTGKLTVLGSSGTRPFMYKLDNGNFQNDSIFNSIAAGNHSLTVKDAKGCVTIKPAVVLVNNIITVQADVTPPICAGTEITLHIQSNATQFQWSPAAGLNNPFSASPVASPVNTTVYHITAISGSCTSTDSVIVVVNPLPLAIAGNGDTICYGKNASLHGSGGKSAIWSPPNYLNNPGDYNSGVVQPKQTITYKLTVSDSNGCTSVNPAFEAITVTPPSKIFIGNDTSMVAGESIILHATDINNSGFITYKWTPSSALSNPFINNPIVNLSEIKIYQYIVVATTAAGCQGTDTINIKVFKKADIYVASAFTPNGDGKNDILHAIPVGIKLFQYFIIYDRWGNKVFATTNPSAGWNGEVNGNIPGNSTSFVWIAAGIDYKGNSIVKKGTVVLIK